jgi:DNA-directed RNA polymerase subunit RPC12/RpoP
MFAVECSECGDEVYFDDSVDVSTLKCPGCGAKIEIEEIED